MPQITKYPTSSTVDDRIFEVFIKSFVSLRVKDSAADFINDLFSPTEKVMLTKRIAIALLLLRDYQYRDISKILRVSVATISTVNISLKHGKGSYKKILDKIMREEKMEEFFQKTIEAIISVPAKSSKGGTLYRYLKQEIKKTSPKKGII